MPVDQVPSVTLPVTLLRLLVLVNSTVCVTGLATSFVSSVASTYLMVRVTVLVSVTSSVACGYFTTSVVSAVVDVTVASATVALSGAS